MGWGKDGWQGRAASTVMEVTGGGVGTSDKGGRRHGRRRRWWATRKRRGGGRIGWGVAVPKIGERELGGKK